MTVQFKNTFTERSLAAIAKERPLADFKDQSSTLLPAGLFPTIGDLYSNDRLSPNLLFHVVGRHFEFHGDGDLTLHLVLDVVQPAHGERRRSALVLAYSARSD